LWNHALTGMEERPSLSYEEMSALISYLWFGTAAGDPSRGKRAFVKRNCATCHEDLRGLSPVAVMTAVWNHGPAIQRHK